MDAHWLALAACLPIALAALSALPLARWLPIIAIVPALAVALLVPAGSVVSVPWLFLGVHLQLDVIGQAFLLFSSVVWLFAALFLLRVDGTQRNPVMFRSFFLLAMGGNLLLIMAADMVTFYVGFALMGLSGYALVLRRTQASRFSARIYIVFTLIGELALFSAMTLVFAASDSLLFVDIAQVAVPPVAMALLLLGFGIKVALPALHVWLPMVYSTAPLVTAAVMSGPMMKAGLLGWLRFIPVGQQELSFWGELLMVWGVLGIVLGVTLGLLQRNVRAVLGYSSIAKMGLISALFGQAMLVPELAAPLILAIVAFAMHHLLVKSSLFLALLEWQCGASRWVLGVLGALSVSLVGAPLTGGAAAKLDLKTALAGELGWLLLLSAIGTALLMTRFMLLLWRTPQRGALSTGALMWLVLLPVAFWGPYAPSTLPLSWDGIGPLLISLPLALAGWWLGSRYRVLPVRPGDMIYPLLRCLPRLHRDQAESNAPTEYQTRWRALVEAPGSHIALVLPGLFFLLLCLLLMGTLLLPL